jgi:hypothetical protein
MLLCLTALAPLGLARQEERTDGDKARQSTSDSRIKKLITQLADGKYQAREEASRQLEEIGVPALAELQEAALQDELETRARAKKLVTAIRTANRLPTWVDGLTFQLKVDNKEWLLPRAGDSTPVNIDLVITNTTSNVYRVYLFHTAKVHLRDTNGKQILAWGWGATRRPAGVTLHSAPLSKNQSVAMAWRCDLQVSKTGRYDFGCSDRDMVGSSASGIAKGPYRLSVIYEANESAKDRKEPYWKGQAVTLEEDISVK